MESYKAAGGTSYLLTVCLALAFCAESLAFPREGLASAGALVSVCCVVQDDGQPPTGAQGGGDPDIDNEVLEEHLPDPELDRQRVVGAIEQARQEGDDNTVALFSRVLERIETIRRPQQLHLTLEDTLRRTLANNYDIQTQSFNPAVETTRIVEAESAFDAIFFSSVTKNKVDKPTGSQLTSSDLDYMNWSTGIRKLLPSGMQVSATYGLQRTKTSIQFQQINPEYFSDLALEMRQPFLLMDA